MDDGSATDADNVVHGNEDEVDGVSTFSLSLFASLFSSCFSVKSNHL